MLLSMGTKKMAPVQIPGPPISSEENIILIEKLGTIQL